ncbi:MAG: flagellar basal body P-ring protein FlgI [Planctomycetota bacterium]
MLLLSILLTLALGAPAQNPAQPQVDAVFGGADAPAQPTGRSTSGVVRTPRIEPTPGRGADGNVLVRIGDLVAVRGQEDNVVQGVGLVTGLAGTGDGSTAARQAIINMLQTQNIVLDPGAVTSANVAVVLVQATLPPGIKPGRKIDVRVSSLYDAISLVGGTLVFCELADVTGQTVFMTASGPVTVGGFSAEGEGASAVRNHLTVGTLPNGGKVERSVPTQLFSDHGFCYLDMKAMKGSFANAVRVSESINELYTGAAVAQDAMTVAVKIPVDLPAAAHVAFLDSILRREVMPDHFARVVVNERTGVIVMGEGVRITRGAITKGNLTVTIAETREASQPGPFSEGQTEVLPRTDLLIEEEDRALTIVNGAVSLQEVVEVLNVLGVTPRDMIQILQLMSQSGMLHAEIVSM